MLSKTGLLLPIPQFHWSGRILRHRFSFKTASVPLVTSSVHIHEERVVLSLRDLVLQSWQTMRVLVQWRAVKIDQSFVAILLSVYRKIVQSQPTHFWPVVLVVDNYYFDAMRNYEFRRVTLSEFSYMVLGLKKPSFPKWRPFCLAICLSTSLLARQQNKNFYLNLIHKEQSIMENDVRSTLSKFLKTSLIQSQDYQS